MIKTQEDLRREKEEYREFVFDFYSETPRIIIILLSSFSDEEKRLLLMAEAIKSQKATN